MAMSRQSRQKIAAAATRREILGAAERLFAEQGYAQTSIVDIAAAAGVSVPKIYASVGQKKALVLALVSFVGEGAGMGDAQRALAAASTADDVLAAAAGLNRRLLEDRGDVVRAIRSAASVEPDVAAAYAATQGMHREGSARVARRLASLGALASTTTPEEATAAIELLTGVETYETLLGRGWSLDRAERWIVAALRRLLLPG